VKHSNGHVPSTPRGRGARRPGTPGAAARRERPGDQSAASMSGPEPVGEDKPDRGRRPRHERVGDARAAGGSRTKRPTAPSDRASTDDERVGRRRTASTPPSIPASAPSSAPDAVVGSRNDQALGGAAPMAGQGIPTRTTRDGRSRGPRRPAGRSGCWSRSAPRPARSSRSRSSTRAGSATSSRTASTRNWPSTMRRTRSRPPSRRPTRPASRTRSARTTRTGPATRRTRCGVWPSAACSRGARCDAACVVG
jgi:hypothetical protein